MKKIIAVLLAVVLVLSFGVISVSAEEAQRGSLFGDPLTAQTDISYRVYSTYSVTVPTNLDYGSQGAISVDLTNVECGCVVNGYVTNTDENGLITLENGMGASTQMCLWFDDEPYVYVDTGLFHTFGMCGEIENCGIKFENMGFTPYNAGTYTGVICFRFECVDLMQ